MCHLWPMQMTPRFSVRADSRRTDHYRAAIAFAVFAVAVACAPKTAPPAPAPTPVAVPPTVMQTCPDPTDGPSILVNAIDEAHRALVANPNTPLPPVCLLAA